MADGDPSDVAARARGPRGDPHVGHDRHAEGGVAREPGSARSPSSYLSKIPLTARDTIHIAAPLFHSWGFAHFSLGLILGMTYVLRRKFDPRRVREVARTHADVLAVVPVMMQRILDLPEETRGKYDTSSLKVVAASGRAARRPRHPDGRLRRQPHQPLRLDRGGATIATPADMRAGARHCAPTGAERS